MSAAKKPAKYHLPDGSRSVQSVWVWRGFFFMSLIAVGVVIRESNHLVFAVCWSIIALGWFTISMWLWRKHVRDDDEAYAASQSGRRKK
jgi:hypothetical protein